MLPFLFSFYWLKYVYKAKFNTNAFIGIYYIWNKTILESRLIYGIFC